MINSNFVQSTPFGQTIEPANSYALVHDNNYTKDDPTTEFLKILGTIDLSMERREQVEILTRGESASRNWYSERCIRLKASNFGKICKCEIDNR